jgi:hypothetical protein
MGLNTTNSPNRCSQMNLKQKLANVIAAHPKLVTFGVGLAVTVAIGTVIGISESPMAYALNDGNNALGQQ